MKALQLLSFFKTERKFKIARIWSNQELAKFSHLFEGDVVNVSGWLDSDKNGRFYADYFSNKKSYTITNYKNESSEAMGYQGKENEIFLDLMAPLPKELNQKFDTVFNHTVLEHVFDVDTAFANLCALSKDTVIVVAPFLQPMHAEYGDFWRFTPTCIQKMFSKNGFTTIYSSFNHHVDASVYIFAIATRNPDKWSEKIPPTTISEDGTVHFRAKPFWDDGSPDMVGSNAIINLPGFVGRTYYKLKKLLKPNN